jgi:hypothetical protein
MRAYSADLRERVLADCDAGLGTRAVAAKYRVSESWVRRLKQVRRQTGRTAPSALRRGPTIERVGCELRLLPPYREHLSQAFARFFMRVGLQ